MKNIIIGGALLACAVLVSSCSEEKKLARQEHRYMKKTYKTLRKVLNEADVTRLRDSVRVLFPSNIMYEFNSSVLNPGVYPAIQRFANALNERSKTEIFVIGHTDSVGTEAYNKELSEHRADTAKKWLVNYKVDAARMHSWGMGSRSPIAANDSEEGRKKNRCVEFVVLYNFGKK